MRINKIQLFLLTFVLVLWSSTTLFAGKYTYSNYQRASTIGLGPLNVEDDHWFDIVNNASWSNRYMHASVENLVRFKYTGQRSKYFNTAWSYKVVFSARGYDENNNLVQINGGSPIELVVSYDETGASNYVDEAVFSFTGLHSVEVDKISLINLTGNLSQVPEDLYLENEINIERYYELDVNEPITINSKLLINDDEIDYNEAANTITREIQFYWDVLEGAEEYDLEWYFVPEASQINYAVDGSDIEDKRFTRVTVGDNKYGISLVYEVGKIYYRVRSVGRFWDKLTQRKEGKWFYCSGAFSVDNFHEKYKNWTYQATYAENGKRKEVVSYADGSTRTRQSVTHLNSENKALIAETFYDFEGRAAIQTLPSTDLNEDGSIRFYKNFNLSSSDITFNKTDFDLDGTGTGCNPLLSVPMSINSGASRYYSPANANKNEQQAYLPDAKEYPYTRTVYDKNGRVKIQSGPGVDHKLGSDHETKYFYGRPLQEDLDRLFGNEAGESKHYSIQAVEDANGQVSISYQNLAGKTVATGLIGTAVQLDDLGSYSSVATAVTSNLLLNNEFFSQENSYEINMSYLAKSSGLHHFTYNVTPETFTSLCSGGDYDCKYDVEITIYDECGTLMTEDGYVPSGGVPSILTQVHQYESAVTPTPITFSVNFPKVGTYKITKKLILNEDALKEAKDAYETHLRTVSNTCFDLASIVGEIQTATDFSGCESCDDYCATHTCPAGYCDDLVNQGVSYDAAESCGDTYVDLQEDMSPGGQYFENNPLIGGNGVPNANWFNANVVNYYNGLGIGTGSFYADFGLTNLGIHNWQELKDNWNPTWPTALPSTISSGNYVFNGLVDFHPEICHAGWCVLSSATKNYDQDLSNVTTLLGAYNAGYFPVSSTPPGTSLNVTSLLTLDPISSVTAYNSVVTTLNSELLSTGTFWSDVVTATQAAYTSPTGDNYWFMCKNKYMQRKNELMYSLELATCPFMCENTDPANGTFTDGITDGCNGEAPGFIINYIDIQSLIANPDLTDGSNVEEWGQDVENLLCKYEVVYDFANNMSSICSGSPNDINGICNGSLLFAPNFSFTCANSTLDAENFAAALVVAINDYGVFNARSDGSVIFIEATNPIFLGSYLKLFKKKVKVLTLGEFVKTCPSTVESDCICDELDLLVASMQQEYPLLSDNDIYNLVQTDLELSYGISIPVGKVSFWHSKCGANNVMDETILLDIEQNYSEVLSNCNPTYDPCDQEEVTALTVFYANQEFESLIEAALVEFEEGYIAHCLEVNSTNNFNEEFTMVGLSGEHHHTLFYYDLVGNLTRTVPPAGVDLLSIQEIQDVAAYRLNPITNAALFTVPSHSFITNYQYNTLNQLVRQNTPDGGVTKFWYDGIGRLILSIDAQQAIENKASYLFYDGLGRSEEAGVFIRSSAPWPDLSNEQAFRNWVTSTMQLEVLVSDYDEVSTTTPVFTTQESQNMRGRIAATYFYNDLSEPYESASFYSYDVHGNVQSLISDNTLLADIGQAHKRTDYDYDLISGNVNKVSYQQGELDQFIHRYDYDADNRITNVYTSQDGFIWDRDANYNYYNHGPLARVELGNKTVQGLDYAYTIQGWLKGINGNQLDTETEMGKDGSLGLVGHYNENQLQQHRSVAKDAFGFTLNYFENDYQAISINGNNFINNLTTSIATGSIGLNGLGSNLYNGNIKSMATTIKDINETAIENNVSVYGYDQLNRIKEVNVNLGNDFNAMQNNLDYHANYSYDANGNLLNLLRNGSTYTNSGNQLTTEMDNFQYVYYRADGVSTYNPVEGVQSPTDATNRLAYVIENSTASEASTGYTGPEFGDIKSGQLINNYQYDKKGQLVKDLQEGIEDITWYQSGKVKAIKRNSEGNDIRFFYDPMGNRIAKIVKPRNGSGNLLGQEEWVYTFYSRDASGNPLATYSKKYESLQGGQANDYEMHYALEEQTLYGSSRLGVKNSNKDIVHRDIRVPHIIVVDGANTFGGEATLLDHTITNEDLGFNKRNVGYKNYELSNHLGNVLVVVTDQKIAIDDHSYIYIGNNNEYYDFNTNLGVYHQNATVTGQYEYSPSSGDGTVDYYEANVISYSDYYPFGMLQPNRNGGENYRYNFQGQESDDEVKGKGNSVNYKYRMHDPRLGRFFAVDPLTPKYPHYTPYSFSGNKVVAHIELEGLEEYSIHQRSFAPWQRFGELPLLSSTKKSFAGDMRGFSLAPHSSNTPGTGGGVSSRIYQKSTINLGVQGGTTSTKSSVTKGLVNFGTAFSPLEQEAFSSSTGEASFDNKSNFTASFKGTDPLVWIAPNIVWKTKLTIYKSSDVLIVHGRVEGKGFPAYESFIEDANGKKVFLSTYQSPNRGDIGTELLNPALETIIPINLKFNLDDQGNFTGKMTYGYRVGNKAEYKETTIDEWNKSHLGTKASTDCPDGDC